MVNNLAFYKIGPSKTVPSRPGPVQCVRNCSNCILRQAQVQNDDPSAEDIISVMSYDDLVHRQSLWFSNYQTIQYHLGQMTLLKRSIDTYKPPLIMFLAAVSEPSDVHYLRMILRKENLPSGDLIDGSIDINQQGAVIVPIRISSCPVTASKRLDHSVDIRLLHDILTPFVEQIDPLAESSAEQALIVPTIITKDHEESSKLKVGSLCVQVLEPYPLIEFVTNVKTQHKTAHMVHHLYHDLAMYGARMASNIVAFLILYLDRPDGVTIQDLEENMDWMRKKAMALELHLAFTGESNQAVEFGLLILSDHIHIDPTDKTIIPKHLSALISYAAPVVPNVAYQGIIARAVLMLHNRDEKNALRSNLVPSDTIKVMKDDLLDLSQELAQLIDTKLPSRKPCRDVRDRIIEVFTHMEICDHYFRIQEARIRQNAGRKWAGDYDSDEEYFLSRRDDPLFKPWVIMTQRPYRLDRLNLYMNAVNPLLTNDNDSNCQDESSNE